MGILPQDDWVDVPPLDEFSLDNAANSVHGRKNRLLRIDRENHRFSEIEQLFRKGWRHRKKNRPRVQLIFKVLWPESMLEPYLAYRSSVQQTVRAKDMRGNEQLLFHGTDRACLLAETRNNVVLCSLQKCSMCSILRTSFEVKRCGKSTLFLLSTILLHIHMISKVPKTRLNGSDMVYTQRRVRRRRTTTPLTCPTKLVFV